MKILFFLVGLVFCTTILFAQDTTQQQPYPDPYEFIEADLEPVYHLADMSGHLVYPPEADAKGIVGKVVLRVLLNEAGKPLAYECLETPDSILTKAAWNAVQHIKFAPAYKEGKPLPFYWHTLQPIVFEQEGNEQGRIALEKKLMNGEVDLTTLPDFQEDARKYATFLDNLPVFNWEDVRGRVRFPDAAFDARFDYEIRIKFFIETDGMATNFTVLEGSRPSVTNALIEAIQLGRYQPATYKGKPVRCSEYFALKINARKDVPGAATSRDRNYNYALPLEDR